MQCPQCGGPMWDNRPKKESGEYKPNSSDFKCKDKSCGGVIWPPKKPLPRPAGLPQGKGNYTPPNEQIMNALRELYALTQHIEKRQNEVMGALDILVQQSKGLDPDQQAF